MTLVEAPVKPEPAAAPEEPKKGSWFDSLLLTVLAILLALLIGGLMIVFSDDQVRTDLGYFFTSPSDFFLDAWYTLRDAYIALF